MAAPRKKCSGFLWMRKRYRAWEIGLADLFIAKNSTGISNQRITDTRYDTSRCGVISSISQFDTTTLYQQVQSDLSNFQDINEAQFLAWFEEMKNQLSEDAAGNLQNEIDQTRSMLSDAYSAAKSYAVGDYCIHDNTLYKCNTAISSEAWTEAHWTETSISSENVALTNSVNTLNSNLTLTTSTANSAYTKATNAATSAATAQTTADTATTKANAAQTTADNASTAASTAQTTANKKADYNSPVLSSGTVLNYVNSNTNISGFKVGTTSGTTDLPPGSAGEWSFLCIRDNANIRITVIAFGYSTSQIYVRHIWNRAWNTEWLQIH